MRMRWALVASLVGGLALTILLVLHFGAPAVAAALGAAGFAGLAVIAAVHLAAIVLTGFAWWLLGREAGKPLVFVWARLMRDSAAEVLPLSQVGGYVLGARALVLHGVAAAVAVATTVVDLTLEMGSQIAYTALGLELLLWLRPTTMLAVPVAIGLVVAVMAAVAFVAVQRRSVGVFERFGARFARDRLVAIAVSAEAVQAEIHEIHGHGRGLWSCFLLHLIAWLASGAEAWLALKLMGLSLGIAPVLALESLLYAIRSIAFIVPNAIGVQEGAYVMLGASFGLAPDFALGLSLLKRGRDLMLGIPALLVWQIFESHRLWRRRSPARAAQPTRAGGMKR
jgi:glycosyltransferase 2 family protein